MITDYIGGGGYVQMITDYMGEGVYRDPQKWLRNIWMTPNDNNNVFNYMSIDDIFDVIDNDDYYLKTWQECTTVWPLPRDRRRCTVALPRLHNQD